MKSCIKHQPTRNAYKKVMFDKKVEGAFPRLLRFFSSISLCHLWCLVIKYFVCFEKLVIKFQFFTVIAAWKLLTYSNLSWRTLLNVIYFVDILHKIKVHIQFSRHLLKFSFFSVLQITIIFHTTWKATIIV